MRVLIVEDDPMIGGAVENGLHEAGYAVDWVRDGNAATLALAHDVYELALLDLGLPRKDGLTVLNRSYAQWLRTSSTIRCATLRGQVARRFVPDMQAAWKLAYTEMGEFQKVGKSISGPTCSADCSERTEGHGSAVLQSARLERVCTATISCYIEESPHGRDHRLALALGPTSLVLSPIYWTDWRARCSTVRHDPYWPQRPRPIPPRLRRRGRFSLLSFASPVCEGFTNQSSPMIPSFRGMAMSDQGFEISTDIAPLARAFQ